MIDLLSTSKDLIPNVTMGFTIDAYFVGSINECVNLLVDLLNINMLL